MKILLCDSNLITASKVGSLLRSQGWEVFSASRWNKAKEILEENADVSIAFVNLEGFGGEEVMENIKKEFPQIKVVAYCGHMNIQLQDKARQLGADMVVPNSSVASQAHIIAKEVTS